MNFYIQFDRFTTIDSINTSLICSSLLHNSWCLEKERVTKFERRTRLLAVNLEAPLGFVLEKDETTRLLLTSAMLHPNRRVAYIAKTHDDRGLGMGLVSLFYVLFICFMFIIFWCIPKKKR
jgi:hypothetical protein